MKGKLIETKKEISHDCVKRLLAYYSAFQKISVNGTIDIFAKEISIFPEQLEEYISCVDNAESELYVMVDFLVESSEEEEKKELYPILEKIKNILQQEIEYEEKLRDYLNKKAENHPIISKIIVVFLTYILLSLVEDCIHDGILNATTKDAVEINQINNIDMENNYNTIINNIEEYHNDVDLTDG